MRTGIATTWAQRHMLLIAGIGLTVILGGVVAVEIYAIRHRSPVTPITPQRPRRYMVIRRIKPLSEATSVEEKSKEGGRVRKPQGTSPE